MTARKTKRNPAKSGKQYRLAEAVAHGTARKKTRMTKKAAKEIIKKTPRKLRSKFAKANHRKRNPAKRNPEASARAAYEDFHGKPPETVITVGTPRHYHGVLAGIGKLKEIYFVGGPVKSIRFGKGTFLCENEKRNQLFIVGGDQSVNLRDFGISNPHETEVLGECKGVVYHTEKLHLIAKDGGKADYDHKFGSVKPLLIYDVRNRLLSFAGGGYTIPSEGIDG